MNRNVVKILHYECGFYVLYEKRPVMGKFKKPVFDMKFPDATVFSGRTWLT